MNIPSILASIPYSLRVDSILFLILSDFVFNLEILTFFQKEWITYKNNWFEATNKAFI